MRRAITSLIGSAGLAAVMIGSGGPMGAQSQQAADGKSFTPPRTADGRPDLQGIYDYAVATPLQRPAALAGKTHYTDDEFAGLEAQIAANRERAAAADAAPLPAGQVGGYNQFWYEFGTRPSPDRRTSLISDPPNGQLPPLTAAAQARADEHRAQLRRNADGPEQRDASERCLLGYNAGPPMVGVGYNQHLQIVQTKDWVVLHTEMVHTARIVPLDGRPFSPKGTRIWGGESRGRWDGDTLVVETRNFNDQQWNQFSGWNWASDENLHVIERFSFRDANSLRYEFTVHDPTVWTTPWSGEAPLWRTDEQMFEYACHEGNHGMEGILRGARADDARQSTK